LFPYSFTEGRLAFYKELAERLGAELEHYLLDLSSQITDISKPKKISKKGWSISSFYLYFHFRQVKEREYYLLCLAVQWLLRNRLSALKEEGSSYLLLYDLYENIVRNELRWSNAKFSKGFILVLDSLTKYKGIESLLPPIREWKGNYNVTNFTDEVLKRIFTIRTERHQNTFMNQELNKRSPKTDRPRGYRDQGSMSSSSDRARRQANQAGFEEVQRIYEKEQKEKAQLSWVKFQFLREQRE